MFGFFKKPSKDESQMPEKGDATLRPDLAQCQSIGKLASEYVESALRGASCNPGTLTDEQYQAASVAVMVVVDALSQRLNAPLELAALWGLVNFSSSFCRRVRGLGPKEVDVILRDEYCRQQEEYYRRGNTIRGRASVQRVGQLALAFHKNGNQDDLAVMGEEILAMAEYETKQSSASKVSIQLLQFAFDEKASSIDEENFAPLLTDVDRTSLNFELRLLAMFATEWGVLGVEAEQPGGARLRRLFRAQIAEKANDSSLASLIAAYPPRYVLYEQSLMTAPREKDVPNLSLAFVRRLIVAVNTVFNQDRGRCDIRRIVSPPGCRVPSNAESGAQATNNAIPLKNVLGIRRLPLH